MLRGGKGYKKHIRKFRRNKKEISKQNSFWRFKEKIYIPRNNKQFKKDRVLHI